MTTQPPRNTVAHLEPRRVWEIFSGIAAVPRASKREERIRGHVRAFAEQHKLPLREDKTGNLVITVPASPGCEKTPITVLQGHLDMVCEKNSGTKHDFDNEGIRMLVDTEQSSGEKIVRADGTTLGADNGIGVALALAAATSPDVTHGPLELLFTIDEEDGMTGAKALTPESFRGRRMLNLDSEEDDALYIGCAGGCDTNVSWTFPASPVPNDLEIGNIRVGGLRGGHSGCDIHEGRANAIKLLTRVLSRASSRDLRLLTISGGSKRNAIPREATATVAGPPGLADDLKKSAADVARESLVESGEPTVNIDIRADQSNAPSPRTTVSAQDTIRLLSTLYALPSGVLGMHPKVFGLVETSNNLSTIETKAGASQTNITAGLLSRSSSPSRIREVLDQLASIGRLSAAAISTANEYPGWSPNPASATLAVCRRVYQELFNKEPKVTAIHAGLECGIIGERVGDMDMVSLGPTIRGAHSPDERVYTASVERAWKYLVALLAALSKN